jgi:hypothetical protein
MSTRARDGSGLPAAAVSSAARARLARLYPRTKKEPTLTAPPRSPLPLAPPRRPHPASCVDSRPSHQSLRIAHKSACVCMRCSGWQRRPSSTRAASLAGRRGGAYGRRRLERCGGGHCGACAPYCRCRAVAQHAWYRWRLQRSKFSQSTQGNSANGGFDQRLRGRDGLAGLGWSGVGRAARPSRPHCSGMLADPRRCNRGARAWRGMSRSFVAVMLSLDELLRPSVPRLLPTALCACEPADAASRESGTVGARAILRCASTACCCRVAIAIGTVVPTGRAVGARSGCLSGCNV